MTSDEEKACTYLLLEVVRGVMGHAAALDLATEEEARAIAFRFLQELTRCADDKGIYPGLTVADFRPAVRGGGREAAAAEASSPEAPTPAAEAAPPTAEPPPDDTAEPPLPAIAIPAELAAPSVEAPEVAPPRAPALGPLRAPAARVTVDTPRVEAAAAPTAALDPAIAPSDAPPANGAGAPASPVLPVTVPLPIGAADAAALPSAPLNVHQRPGAMPPPGSRVTPEVPRPKFRLPNGRIGEPYRAPLEAVAADGRALDVLHLEVPEGCGLSYDVASHVVVGTPARDGELTMRVHYRYAGDRDRPALEAVASLVVNPDPRTLWKNQPSDQSDAYWKPDEDHALVAIGGGRRMVAASKRGRSHAHAGLFRDDDFRLAHDPESGWSVLAVADGAGSSRYSRRGALLATRTVVEALGEAVNGPDGQRLAHAAAELGDDPASRGRLSREVYGTLGQAVWRAMKAIEDEAARKGAAPKDFATTLLVALHRPVARGHFVATFWCGDGAIGLYSASDAERPLRLMGEADSGDFAGQTRFLDRALLSSNEEINRRLRVAVVPDLTALVLMTDGVSDPKFDTERNLADPAWWARLWGELEPCLAAEGAEARLLEWLDFWSQGNHDDRTIALLW